MAECTVEERAVDVAPHTILRVVCAWCGAVMGSKDGKGVSGDSHSCCPACLERLLANVGEA
jgi:hypothetical protein